ncbi:MAG: hypothetical protein ACRCTR_01945 [Actinomycetota bacterium]
MGHHRQPGKRRAANGPALGSPSDKPTPSSTRQAGTRRASVRNAASRKAARELLGWGAFAACIAAVAIVATGNSWQVAGAVLGVCGLAVLTAAAAFAASRYRS